MSDRFEKAIQDWYDRSRTVNLEYLDLSEKPKSKFSEIENNISVVFDRLSLFSKVSLKIFNQIKGLNQSLGEHLVRCEDLFKKNQSETRKSLELISSEIRETKPLTKKEVLELVREISQQPKFIEEEALKLTSDLDKRIQQVEQQIHKVEHLVTDIKKFLTT